MADQDQLVTPDMLQAVKAGDAPGLAAAIRKQPGVPANMSDKELIKGWMTSPGVRPYLTKDVLSSAQTIRTAPAGPPKVANSSFGSTLSKTTGAMVDVARSATKEVAEGMLSGISGVATSLVRAFDPSAPPPVKPKPSNGVGMSAGPKPSIMDVFREGQLSRAIGTSTESVPEVQRQKAAGDNRLLHLEAAYPPGIARGAAEFTSSLTTPGNLLLMALTGGSGGLEEQIGRPLIQRLVSAGFSAQMLVNAYNDATDPSLRKAIDDKDWAQVREKLTKMALTLETAHQGVRHAVTGEKAASQPSNETGAGRFSKEEWAKLPKFAQEAYKRGQEPPATRPELLNEKPKPATKTKGQAQSEFLEKHAAANEAASAATTRAGKLKERHAAAKTSLKRMDDEVFELETQHEVPSSKEEREKYTKALNEAKERRDEQKKLVDGLGERLAKQQEEAETATATHKELEDYRRQHEIPIPRKNTPVEQREDMGFRKAPEEVSSPRLNTQAPPIDLKTKQAASGVKPRAANADVGPVRPPAPSVDRLTPDTEFRVWDPSFEKLTGIKKGEKVTYTGRDENGQPTFKTNDGKEVKLPNGTTETALKRMMGKAKPSPNGRRFTPTGLTPKRFYKTSGTFRLPLDFYRQNPDIPTIKPGTWARYLGRNGAGEPQFEIAHPNGEGTFTVTMPKSIGDHALETMVEKTPSKSAAERTATPPPQGETPPVRNRGRGLAGGEEPVAEPQRPNVDKTQPQAEAPVEAPTEPVAPTQKPEPPQQEPPAAAAPEAPETPPPATPAPTAVEPEVKPEAPTVSPSTPEAPQPKAEATPEQIAEATRLREENERLKAAQAQSPGTTTSAEPVKPKAVRKPRVAKPKKEAAAPQPPPPANLKPKASEPVISEPPVKPAETPEAKAPDSATMQSVARGVAHAKKMKAKRVTIVPLDENGKPISGQGKNSVPYRIVNPAIITKEGIKDIARHMEEHGAKQILVDTDNGKYTTKIEGTEPMEAKHVDDVNSKASAPPPPESIGSAPQPKLEQGAKYKINDDEDTEEFTYDGMGEDEAGDPVHRVTLASTGEQETLTPEQFKSLIADGIEKVERQVLKNECAKGQRATHRRISMPSSEVMSKWKRGELHSGSKKGRKVKSRKQAIAIMLSEKRNEQKHGGKYRHKKRS